MFILGDSMGGAVGVLTAEKDARIKVLVSLAGMVFTRAFAAREFADVTPDEGAMWDELDCPLSQIYMDDMATIDDVVEEAARITQPWLLIHGTDDDVVPMSDSIAAHQAATCEKSWLPIEGAQHMFGAESFPLIAHAIDRWLKKYIS